MTTKEDVEDNLVTRKCQAHLFLNHSDILKNTLLINDAGFSTSISFRANHQGISKFFGRCELVDNRSQTFTTHNIPMSMLIIEIEVLKILRITADKDINQNIFHVFLQILIVSDQQYKKPYPIQKPKVKCNRTKSETSDDRFDRIIFLCD